MGHTITLLLCPAALVYRLGGKPKRLSATQRRPDVKKKNFHKTSKEKKYVVIPVHTVWNQDEGHTEGTRKAEVIGSHWRLFPNQSTQPFILKTIKPDCSE